MQLTMFQRNFYKITPRHNNQNVLPDYSVFGSLLDALKTAKILDRKSKTPGLLCINELVASTKPSPDFENEGSYVTRFEVSGKKIFYFLNKEGMKQLEKIDGQKRHHKILEEEKRVDQGKIEKEIDSIIAPAYGLPELEEYDRYLQMAVQEPYKFPEPMTQNFIKELQMYLMVEKPMEELNKIVMEKDDEGALIALALLEIRNPQKIQQYRRNFTCSKGRAITPIGKAFLMLNSMEGQSYQLRTA